MPEIAKIEAPIFKLLEGRAKRRQRQAQPDILIHRAAKKAFDDMGVGKLPTVKSLQAEFAALLTEDQSSYAQLTAIRKELRELAVHKANYEELLTFSHR